MLRKTWKPSELNNIAACLPNPESQPVIKTNFSFIFWTRFLELQIFETIRKDKEETTTAGHNADEHRYGILAVKKNWKCLKS